MNPENTGFTQPVCNLRDELAIERTILANEQSLLSYIRTTVTCLAAGLSLLHFFQTNLLFRIIASLFLALSLSTIIYGINRYRKVKKIVQNIDN